MIDHEEPNPIPIPVSRSRQRWRLRLFVVGSLVLFVGLLGAVALPFLSVSGQGVTATEANARLWNCLVPDDATDVWYSSSCRSTQVECTLDPESFRLWCERRGWRLKPIAEGETFWIGSLNGDLIPIHSGFFFREMNGDVGFSGRYDLANKRAHVSYSGG